MFNVVMALEKPVIVELRERTKKINAKETLNKNEV